MSSPSLVNVRKVEQEGEKYYSIEVTNSEEKAVSMHSKADFIGLKKILSIQTKKPQYTNPWVKFPWTNFEQQIKKFCETLLNDAEFKDKSSVRSFFNLSTQKEKDFFHLGSTEKKGVVQSDYEFLSPIGHGACGQLFLVRDKVKKQSYAVKVVEKRHVNPNQNSSQIMTERDLLVKTRDNPFFCKIYFSFQSENKLFFLLEYINGGDMYSLIQNNNYLPEKRIIFYSAEIACALGYLHKNEIIYRDLKPENIMINSEGHVVLTDFGLCKEIIKKKTTNSFCGTPEYIAPEILNSKPYKYSVDWWALGCVVYEFYHRVPPFYSTDPSKIVRLILEHNIKFKDDVSEVARNFITELLHMDPDKRLGSKGGYEEIKKHRFFATINWNLLELRKIEPDYKPNVSSKEDTALVPDEFKNKEISASIISSYKRGLFDKEDQKKMSKNFMEGFSYCPRSEELNLHK